MTPIPADLDDRRAGLRLPERLESLLGRELAMLHVAEVRFTVVAPPSGHQPATGS